MVRSDAPGPRAPPESSELAGHPASMDAAQTRAAGDRSCEMVTARSPRAPRSLGGSEVSPVARAASPSEQRSAALLVEVPKLPVQAAEAQVAEAQAKSSARSERSRSTRTSPSREPWPIRMELGSIAIPARTLRRSNFPRQS